MIRIASWKEAEDIALTYNIPLSEIIFCEMNRTGVWLELNQVPPSFRVRFLCDEKFSTKPPMYFAVPVRECGKSNFMINREGHLMFGSVFLGQTADIEIDTCDCSYFRKDKKVLNLNSNRKGSCQGCEFCIHNHPLYDKRVLKDQEKIKGKPDLRRFFKEEIMAKHGFKNLSHLEQIAVVTGLFEEESLVIQHISDIREVASEFKFSGSIFFLGFELMSKSALDEIKAYGPFSLCYSIDCFTNRKQRLTRKKGIVPISSILQTLTHARECGFEVTFSYIVGLDSLKEILNNVNELSKIVNRFPIVNIYQIQHLDQGKIIQSEAQNFDYYLQARKIFETIFVPTGLHPHNWENYRSLWYHYFGNKYITE